MKMEEITLEKIEDSNISELCALLELTSSNCEEGIIEVRDLIMDAIESRDPVGFSQWLDRYDDGDEELKYYVSD